MPKRKYPCTAKIKETATGFREGFEDLPGKEITVLEEAKYHNCCCNYGHKVELPDGYPDPPENCATWMIFPESLDFLD